MGAKDNIVRVLLTLDVYEYIEFAIFFNKTRERDRTFVYESVFVCLRQRKRDREKIL